MYFLLMLEVDFIDRMNKINVDLDKNCLHLNIKGKSRLELNFILKLQNIWSAEPTNKT